MRQSENSTFGAAQRSSIERSSLVADLDLIQRVNSNQPGAIEELIELHGCHLQRLIASVSGRSSLKDDLMQETLLKAWNSANTYRGNAPLRHWLTQIAIRVCRNHQRGYRRWMMHLKLFWEQQTEQPCDAADDRSQYCNQNIDSQAAWRRWATRRARHRNAERVCGPRCGRFEPVRSRVLARSVSVGATAKRCRITWSISTLWRWWILLFLGFCVKTGCALGYSSFRWVIQERMSETIGARTTRSA
jgi:DNA-directed RNA polymerase specialized sigma24 family protein